LTVARRIGITLLMTVVVVVVVEYSDVKLDFFFKIETRIQKID